MQRRSSTASRTSGERLLNEGSSLACVCMPGSCCCWELHVRLCACVRSLLLQAVTHSTHMACTCSWCANALAATHLFRMLQKHVVVRMRARMHQKHGYYVFAQDPKHVCSMRSAGRHICCCWCCWCCWPPIDLSRCMSCKVCTGGAESGPVLLMNGL